MRGEAGEGGSQGDGAALQGGGPQTGTGRGLRGRVEGGLARAQWALAPWRGHRLPEIRTPAGEGGTGGQPASRTGWAHPSLVLLGGGQLQSLTAGEVRRMSHGASPDQLRGTRVRRRPRQVPPLLLHPQACPGDGTWECPLESTTCLQRGHFDGGPSPLAAGTRHVHTRVFSEQPDGHGAGAVGSP